MADIKSFFCLHNWENVYILTYDIFTDGYQQDHKNTYKCLSCNKCNKVKWTFVGEK